MSSTTTIGLRKLLCCVFEAEIARREAVIQRCAELALQDEERGRDLSADDLSILQNLSDGRVSRDAIRKDARMRAILGFYRPQAADYV